MVSQENNKKENAVKKLVDEMKAFAITVGEECPEGHRRNPHSGACLPMGSTDHTAFTRSLNDDWGPYWRGEEDKQSPSIDGTDVAAENKETALMSAEEMDEPVSCSEGTTFSFIERKCISLEAAEAENNDSFIQEAADHEKVVALDPEGRKDTVGFQCPPDQFFNFGKRECIPLNKGTVMASEEIDDKFKKAVACLPDNGRLAVTSPDPLDGHVHLVTVDQDGNGMTSVAAGYGGSESYPHSHEVEEYEVQPYEQDDYVSRHFGYVTPKAMWEYDEDDDNDAMTSQPVWSAEEKAALIEEEGEFAAKLKHKERKALPDSAFGVPGKRKFPLHDCNHVRNAMARFSQAKGLSSAEKSTLRSKIMSRAKQCGIKTDTFGKASTAAEFAAIAEEQDLILKEIAAPIKSKQRTALPDSSFGVPGKRKFPLDSCARVRNAMARFNQAKGLSSAEKATLRRKILAAANKCGIEVKNFAKANTNEEFSEVLNTLLLQERIVKQYAAKDDEKAPAKKGPCPPWMEWDPKAKKCMKAKGFYQILKEQAQATNPDPIARDPEGRKDTPGFVCPDGYFFNFGLRKCIPLDPSKKIGTQPGDTTKASKEGEKDLVPSPEGRPDRLADDCPPGTIWVAYLRKCKQLDTTKIPTDGTYASEEAKIPQGGPGVGKDVHGCLPGQYFDAKSNKCVKGPSPVKDMPKGLPHKGSPKYGSEEADAKPGNREGLVPPPAGKVKLPEDCPKGTIWDAALFACRPLDTRDKNRPKGKSPEDPKNTANVGEMTVAQLIHYLDEIIKSESAEGKKEKAKTEAKDLPNEAFPPSMVSATRRSLMHHTPEVKDSYDNASVDVSRLRNALARAAKVEGYSVKAVEDAVDHLIYHAREVVQEYLGKS